MVEEVLVAEVEGEEDSDVMECNASIDLFSIIV